MRRSRALALPGAVMALLALTACGGGSPTRSPAALGSPAASAGTSGSSASPPAAATPSATPAATPVATVPRTAAGLRSSLLALDDLPAGYAVGPAGGDQLTTVQPECRAAVALLNGVAATGAVASAVASFDGGTDSASFDESLDAYAAPASAAAAMTGDLLAFRQCPTLKAKVERSTLTFGVAEISFPKSGNASFAVRLTADVSAVDPRDEDLKALADQGGLEVLVAGVQVDDVVLHTVSYDGYADDAASTTKDAVTKLQHGARSTA